MSVRTMAKVWEGSRHHGSELVMLLAIADFADDAGRAYPSITTLAAKCRTKRRYALVLLDALSKSGELEIRRNAGPMGRGGRTNLYRVVFENLTHRVPELVNHRAPVYEDEPVNQSAPLRQRQGVRSSAPVNRSAPVHQGSGSGEPECQKVVNQSAPKPSGTIRTIEEVRKAPRDAAERGSRLPADWTLPDEWRAWCRTERPELDIDEVAATFRDHWLGQPGAKGRKSDWLATWRNWVRRERRGQVKDIGSPTVLDADEQFTVDSFGKGRQ